MPANSFHHQAIKALGRGLVPMAFAKDGIIEAVYSTEHPFIRAYQWHPERLFDADEHHKKIFSEFITACKEI
jgi:putative glutamine amidotransferase